MVRIVDLEKGNYWKHMHMTSECSGNEKVQVVLEVTEELKQIYGNVHGGAIAGLMDSCIAVAVNQQLNQDEGASTIGLKLDFLRSVNQGTLRAEGKVIKKGKNIIFGQGEIKDGTGNLVAHGTATFIINKIND